MTVLRRLWRCRRGTVALMFTAAAIPTIGLTALGAEAGSWYLIRRHAQNAADAAAYAGALALTVGQSEQNGLKYAARNGFCTTGTAGCAAPAVPSATQSVTITPSGGNTIVTAVVTQFEPPLLASLFMTGNVPIIARAVAQITHPEQPCALSLSGTLEIGGNQTFTGGHCSLVSNTNIKFDSSATFQGAGWSVDASQGCLPNANSCTPINAAYNYSQPPTKAPPAYTALATQTFATGASGSPPNCNTATCTALTPSLVSQGDLVVSNNGIQNLTCPTASHCTYLFHSITVKSGGTLTSCTAQPTAANWNTCTPVGVNIVIGAGGLSINGNVNLTAAATNNDFPNLDGVLFYDTERTNNLTINGSSNSIYGGALFFPNVNQVTWNGNSASTTNCTMIVAPSLKLTGNSNLNVVGCVGTTVPNAQIVLLVS